jgi:hypothetical protein
MREPGYEALFSFNSCMDRPAFFHYVNDMHLIAICWWDFHYDALDFKSLTVFIYLTDVDASCGPHVLIKNTHKTVSNQAADAVDRLCVATITSSGTSYFGLMGNYSINADQNNCQTYTDSKERLINSRLHEERWP